MKNPNAETPNLDPDEQFTDPAELLAREDLSTAQKIEVLESWRSDLVQLLKAVEENMPSAVSGPGDTAARLAMVSEAIAKLKDREADC